jgi:chromatin segregation and condensation protein Rec8/ScpA/Scc1 (kleisin family)
VLSFREWIRDAESRVTVIVDFLAVLELIRARYLEARQAGAFGDIELVRIEGAQPPSGSQVAEDIPGL